VARLFTALLCAAAMVTLGACGESEQEQAREAVQGYVDAQNDDDFGAICDLYSDAFKAQLGITAEACPAFVEEQSSGAATSFELVGVNVKGDTAFADIDATSEDAEGPSRLTVTLAREDDEWVITGLQ
jgi:ketosteroid isomerase-like protein